jgi:hypothetical protein
LEHEGEIQGQYCSLLVQVLLVLPAAPVHQLLEVRLKSLLNFLTGSHHSRLLHQLTSCKPLSQADLLLEKLTLLDALLLLSAHLQSFLLDLVGEI